MSGSTKAIKVGILGHGNIGAGTVEILQRNGGLIERRLGVPFEVARAADLDPARAERLGLAPGVFTTDAMSIVKDPEIQVVVELIGGIEPARSLILAAMDHGKHVVTANKALLARQLGHHPLLRLGQRQERFAGRYADPSKVGVEFRENPQVRTGR